MTSFREQVIEHVVGRIIPGLRQCLLRNSQPSGTFRIGFDCDKNLRFVGQRQSLAQNQFTVLVKSLDCRGHTGAYFLRQGFGKLRR